MKQPEGDMDEKEAGSHSSSGLCPTEGQGGKSVGMQAGGPRPREEAVLWVPRCPKVLKLCTIHGENEAYEK